MLKFFVVFFFLCEGQGADRRAILFADSSGFSYCFAILMLKNETNSCYKNKSNYGQSWNKVPALGTLKYGDTVL